MTTIATIITTTSHVFFRCRVPGTAVAVQVLLVLVLAGPARADDFGTLLDELEALDTVASWQEIRARLPELSAQLGQATPRQKVRFQLLKARNSGLAMESDRAIAQVLSVLAQREEVDPDLRLRALNLATNLLVFDARFEQGFEFFRQALELAPSVEDPAMRADTYSVAAEFHNQIGEYATATEFAERALALAKAAGSSRQQCIALERRGRARLATGQVLPARSDYQRMIGLCESGRDLIFGAMAHLGMGRSMLATGEVGAAERSIRRSLRLFDRSGYDNGRLEARVALAGLLLDTDRFEQAEYVMAEARGLLELSGRLFGRDSAWQILSTLARHRGDEQSAVEFFRNAMEYRREQAERERSMRLTLLMTDQDDYTQRRELELLRQHNRAIQLNRENRLQGELAVLYAGSGTVIAGVLLFILLFQAARDRHRFRKLSQTDGLTGLLNHTRFFELAEQAFQRSRQQAQPFALVVADIDLFKQVNDHYGHLVGDAVLRRIGARFEEAFGPGAIVGRLGGEEFGVALEDCDTDAAVARIEHLRATLNRQRNEDDEPEVTMSFGVAEHSHERKLDMLYAQADQALFDAKDAGRNRLIAVAQLPFEGRAFVT